MMQMIFSEVRFSQYGLISVEVVDNGCGIADEDHESVGMMG
jgi:DNA mismatch repair protein PMS2